MTSYLNITPILWLLLQLLACTNGQKCCTGKELANIYVVTGWRYHGVERGMQEVKKPIHICDSGYDKPCELYLVLNNTATNKTWRWNPNPWSGEEKSFFFNDSQLVNVDDHGSTGCRIEFEADIRDDDWPTPSHTIQKIDNIVVDLCEDTKNVKRRGHKRFGKKLGKSCVDVWLILELETQLQHTEKDMLGTQCGRMRQQDFEHELEEFKHEINGTIALMEKGRPNYTCHRTPSDLQEQQCNGKIILCLCHVSYQLKNMSIPELYSRIGTISPKTRSKEPMCSCQIKQEEEEEKGFKFRDMTAVCCKVTHKPAPAWNSPCPECKDAFESARNELEKVKNFTNAIMKLPSGDADNNYAYTNDHYSRPGEIANAGEGKQACNCPRKLGASRHGEYYFLAMTAVCCPIIPTDGSDRRRRSSEIARSKRDGTEAAKWEVLATDMREFKSMTDQRIDEMMQEEYFGICDQITTHEYRAMDCTGGRIIYCMCHLSHPHDSPKYSATDDWFSRFGIVKRTRRGATCVCDLKRHPCFYEYSSFRSMEVVCCRNSTKETP